MLGLVAPVVVTACAEPELVVERRVRVEVGPPELRDVDVALRYPVDLAADESVAITPVAISGFLRKVSVDVGDKVTAGQLIAVVDCREYDAQRTQAKTAIAKREAQVDESRTRFERLVAMGEKLVAPAEIDNALKEARVAEAELADAQAKLSEAGQRQGYCSLAAPFSGYVTERFLDPGAMVSPGGPPIVNIVKTFDVRIVASVVERDAPKIERGARVNVVLHAFPEAPFRAEVARVGRALDPSTRTLRVEMNISNKSERLLPGMTGRAEIIVDTREDALLVPITALLKLEEVTYAYVVRDEDRGPTARRIAVKTGVDFGDWIEVTEGLTATDQVIIVGRELVDDGVLVDVVAAVDRPRAAAPQGAGSELGLASIEPEIAPAPSVGADEGRGAAGPVVSKPAAKAKASTTKRPERPAAPPPEATTAGPEEAAAPAPEATSMRPAEAAATAPAAAADPGPATSHDATAAAPEEAAAPAPRSPRES